MTITVSGPDGSTFQFPDETSPDVMKGALQKHYGVATLPPPPMPPGTTPYAQAAGVSDPNDPRFTQQSMDVKQFWRGVPVAGPALTERGSAAMSALAHPMTGAGAPGGSYSERYIKNLQQEIAARQAYEAAHPVRSAAMQGLGGTVALGGLGGASPLAARAMGMVGPAREAVPLAMGTGALLAGSDAASRGEDPTRAAIGGALTGAGGVIGGKAVGRIWDAARGAFVDAPRIPNTISVDVGGAQPNVIPTSESQITRNPVTGGIEQQALGTNNPIAVQADQATRAGMQQAHTDLADRIDPSGAGAGRQPGEMGDVAVQDLVTQEQQRASSEVARILGMTGPGGQTQQLARSLGGGVAGPMAAQDVGSLIGQGVRSQQATARAATQAAYGAHAALPATFNPRWMINAGTDIRSALDNPAAGLSRVAITPQLTPRAQAMLDAIDQEIAQLRFTNDAARGNRPITPSDMERVRQNLVQNASDARAAARATGVWTDARATGRVLDAFDAWVQATATRPGGLLTGDPAAIQNAITAARAAHASERSRFAQQGAGDVVGRFMEQVRGKYPGQEMSPEKIISSLFGKPGGTPPENAVPILNHLRDNVFGANSPEWAAVKRALVDHLTATPAGGEPIPLPEQAARMERFLANDRHAGAIFDAAEQARLQQHANNLRGAAPEELPQPGTPERVLADIAGRQVGAPPGKAQTGQQLMAQLMGPRGGEVALALQQGIPKETYEGLKRSVLEKATQAPEGAIAWQHQKSQQQIAKFLQTDFARKALTSTERTYLTNIMNAHAQLVPLENTTNPSKTAYTLARMSHGVIHKALSGLGLVHGGLHGYLVGQASGRAIEAYMARNEAARIADLFLGRKNLVRQGARVPGAIGATLGQLPALRDQSSQ